MAYREVINVATGVKAQLDACITALDLHENPPQEIEDLTGQLEAALQTCDTIIRKGENEPDEQSTTTGDAGGASEVSASTEGDANATPAKKEGQIGQVFEDQQA